MSAVRAEAAFRKGDFAEAERLCDLALCASPEDVQALRVKGMTLARTNRPELAAESFKQALRIRPDDFLVLEWLQGALMQSGRYAEAVQFGERARVLRPRDVNILVGLSQACVKCGDHPRAVRSLESARGLEPANAAVRHFLGVAYEKSKRNREALAEYREAIRLHPTLRDAYDRANRILLEDGRFAAALRLCESAFMAVPDYGQAHLQAAQALRALGRPDNSDLHAAQAVTLDPGLAWAVATWYQSIGHNEEAVALLERSIEANPIQGRTYYGLVKSRHITEADRPLVDRIVALGRSPELPPKERTALLRALGKASDDLGDYESAMRYFDEAAHVGAKAFGMEGVFDPHRLDAARQRFLRMFDPTLVERSSTLGRVGSSPIFVIGMIRSGTTLVQQILTSHPEVGDAGEQPFWTTEFSSIVDLDAGELRRGAFVDARDRYLEVLRRFDAESPYVANKWPMNYAHAGLLRIAYPDAKIIHVARNPIDTALSIYMTDLGEPRPEFSYDKQHIVDVYRDYQIRMAHWSLVLPESAILTVCYEDLVADPETHTRTIIAHCGLDWDDRCLRFYEGARQINTPSMLQACLPIYTTSIDKWRRYTPHLGPLVALNRDPERVRITEPRVKPWVEGDARNRA